MATELSKLAASIRNMRREQNISQDALAEMAGIDRNYLSEVECGVRNVTYRTLRKIASGLGVSVSELTMRLDAD